MEIFRAFYRKWNEQENNDYKNSNNKKEWRK